MSIDDKLKHVRMLIMDDFSAVTDGLLNIATSVAPKALADIYDYWVGKKDTTTGSIIDYFSPSQTPTTVTETPTVKIVPGNSAGASISNQPSSLMERKIY